MTNYQFALNLSALFLFNAFISIDGFAPKVVDGNHLLRPNYLQGSNGFVPHAYSSSYTAKSRLYDMATSSNFELPEDLPNDGSAGRPSKSNPGTDNRKNDDLMSSPSSSRFVVGDELHELRFRVIELREQLVDARKKKEKSRVNKLERVIVMAQAMDAEFVYAVSIERMEAALAAGLKSEAEEYERDAMAARSALPQFNLEGLWVGKYGDHGFEMINITYVGNTLVAHKVTGDENVPKGEATFKVDLNPQGFKSPFLSQSSPSSKKGDVAGGVDDFNGGQEDGISEKMNTEPMELSDAAAKQWGCKYLQRFAGSGHIATKGFESSEWVDGQMILVKDYFCFVWLPIKHQVFFGRPTADYILKHLRETNEPKPESNEVALSDLRFLERCMEETDLLDDEMEADDITPFISHEQKDYYHQDGCFE